MLLVSHCEVGSDILNFVIYLLFFELMSLTLVLGANPVHKNTVIDGATVRSLIFALNRAQMRNFLVLCRLLSRVALTYYVQV